MKEFNYVPIYRVGLGEITQGIEIHASEFCCRNCSCEKCQNFYRELLDKEDGQYQCPYGFATVIFSDEFKERYIFTGLRLEKTYNPKLVDPKIKQSKGDRNKFRKLTEEEIKKYIEYYIEYKKSVESYSDIKNFVEDIFHDIRKFNAQLKGRSEILCRDSSNHRKLKKFNGEVQQFRAICAFMSLRLNAYDFMYNEVPMDATEKSNYNVFKIFDKVRHCLNDKAHENGITINIDSKGECGDIVAYDCIELLPYILLDNAIKYSDSKSTIYVDIDENPVRCKFKVTSQSVPLKKEEYEKIFIRGFRGENAKERTSEGLGIGLYTAKKICDLHNATINISQEKGKEGKNRFVIDIRIEK